MARLTEPELQEVVRYLEADRPLPEKYRFLLFEEKREVELVWNGKSNEVTRIVLPFQTIEQVDEPRAEKQADAKRQGLLFDARGRQMRGWTNKLIWGDNKLILSSLTNGPMRQEIEQQGGLKLIYIDPPFDVGADFSMNMEIGEEGFTKKANILEEIAYRDTWGKGIDSFVAMLYERLLQMHSLLDDDGSIFIHCDWRVGSTIKLCLDEIFGKDNFRNEIIWCYTGPGSPGMRQFNRKHDTLFWYSKGNKWTFNKDAIRVPYKDPNQRPRKAFDTGDAFSDEAIKKLREQGKVLEDWWNDIAIAVRSQKERTGYPTQKPLALCERIIRASSNKDELVADFFCGSGTLAVAAEKLGRRWIASDLGKFAIHTTRKRMIGVQRELKTEGKDYRAFEILNLGKFERQHFIGVNPHLREEEKRKLLEAKEEEFLELILGAYRADKVDGFTTFHGKCSGRLVAIGPVNLPVSRLFVEEIIMECQRRHITKADILGFEFEMGLFPNMLDEARQKGIDIAPKYIPADVFDKRAVEKNQVVFHDVAYIEVKPHVNGNFLAIELTDFSVYYSQDAQEKIEGGIRNNGSKVIIERGKIIKISKDKDGVISRENLAKHWKDWIDYWSVDFDYESKREIVRVRVESDDGTEDWEERYTGEYIFENEWQSFRTRKNRQLELVSAPHECSPGSRKVAIKVVDIFGNDTMTIINVTIGGKG